MNKKAISQIRIHNIDYSIADNRIDNLKIDTIIDNETTDAVIEKLSGNTQYIFNAPLNSLTINEIDNTTFEDEIIFTSSERDIPPTMIVVEGFWEYTWQTLISLSEENNWEYKVETYSNSDNGEQAYDYLETLEYKLEFDNESNSWNIVCSGMTHDSSYTYSTETGEQTGIEYDNRRDINGIFASSKDLINWEIINEGNVGNVIDGGDYFCQGSATEYSFSTNGEKQKCTITLPENVKLINNTSINLEKDCKYIFNFKNEILCYGKINSL